MRTSSVRSVVAGVVAALALTACTGGGDTRDVAEGLAGQGGVMGVAAAALVGFDACDDYLGYVRGLALEQVGPYGLDGGMSIATADGGAVRADAAEESVAGAAPAPEAAAGATTLQAGVDYSQTNVQEEGVDEPDTVKTDGEVLVAVTTGVPDPEAADPFAPAPALQVVGVDGGEPEQLAQLPLEGWEPQLLLSGDHVLVLSRSSWDELPDAARPDDLGPEEGYLGVTRIDVVDLADPTAPRVAGTRVVEGDYVSARLADGVVRLVTRTVVKPLAFTFPQSDDPGEVERATSVNRQVVEDTAAEDWLPRAATLDADGTVLDEGLAVACSDVSRPAEPHGLGTLTVSTIDATSGTPAGPATAVVAQGDTVYASPDTLYVALSTGGWGVPMPLPMPVDPVPMPEPRPLPEEPIPVEPDGGIGDGAGAPPSPGTVEPAPPVEPSPDAPVEEPAPDTPVAEPAPDAPVADDVAEPTSPDADVAPAPSMPAPPPVTTEVHAFDLSDPTTATYVASGEVDGTLLNQFSMSEHDGHLRLATTLPAGADGSGVSESAVTVLARAEDRLEQVGQVTGLGATEQIYAVRFMGPVGYVVTFRQVDPLYTLDLSDPTAPAVVGELKIPGYSSYLHPVGDGLLLGIGQDATDTGQTTGAQASLFDVGDLAAPERLAALAFGDFASTSAEYDHHAFLWWEPASLAVLPVSDFSGTAPDGQAASWAVGLRVDPAGGLSEAGRITHPQPEPPPGADVGERIMFGAEPATIDRALVVGDLLYTVSDVGVKASSLDTLADVAWLGF